MIISMKKGAPQEEINKLVRSFEEMGLSVTTIYGEDYNVFGLVGDTTRVDETQIAVNPYVDTVTRVSAPYKKVNRLFHPEDSVIDCGGVRIGGQEKIAMIAGPCSVEGLDPIVETAKAVKAAGATMLRGGAYKPRTSPYAFQGLGTEGILDLVEAKKATGLPIVSELMAIEHLDEFVEHVDLIQVGARNMQNFDLLKALGKTNKPVLLKRGLANTMEEWLMSAEYIMAGGNENVILCERGIRTFETMIRNNLDISAIPLLKRQSHLPVIVDPSHAAGTAWMVEPLARAAIAAGADGLIVEVHNNPKAALCDGAQSLNPEQFDALMGEVRRRAAFEGKQMQ